MNEDNRDNLRQQKKQVLQVKSNSCTTVIFVLLRRVING